MHYGCLADQSAPLELVWLSKKPAPWGGVALCPELHAAVQLWQQAPAAEVLNVECYS